MKQLVWKSFAICLFLIFLSSCQEPYFQDNLDYGKKFLVIQGSINNGTGPYIVTLFWASPFGSDQMNSIDDATVFIYDNQENQEQLTMSSPGYYVTSKDGFTGIPGRTYTLHIVLSDGDVYESIPTMLDTVSLTYSLYEQIGTLEDYQTNTYGRISTTTYEGLHCYVDMTLNATQQHYYHYTTSLISQTMLHVNPGSPDSYTKFIWDVTDLNEIPNIKKTISKNNEQIIKEHQLGFIRYLSDYYIEYSLAPRGWILKTNIYSISNEVYNYYQSVVRQLNSNNQIFDPIQSQINGNIKCLTDTTKIALGIFEVAAKYSIITGIYWNPRSEDIKKVELPPDYELPLGYGFTINNPPAFWVNFF